MRVLARCISAALLPLAPLGAAPAAVAAPSPAAPAPLRHSSRAVPDQYIVTMEQGVDSTSAAHSFGNVSPASAFDAVAVGATDINDNQASFSNHGPCLSLFAPGVDIISAKLGGGSQTLSGTSMASPHVAGVALLYLETDPTADPATVGGFINAQATPDVLNVDVDSPNLMLYTGGL